jgi:ATP-dependent Clp endopeptidase proteolytic subunit ClpP
MLTKLNIQSGLIQNNEEGFPEIFKPKIITINEFGTFCANQFETAFNLITNSIQPYVILSINSPGGSVFELHQMRDLISVSKKPVVGFGGGMVFSAASLLLTSCTKGYRWMSPNSKLMIHEVATSSEGKSSDIISDAMETEKLNDELFEILAKNAGKPKLFFKNLIRKKNNADFFLSAEECKQYGLIDHVGVPEFSMNVEVNWGLTNLSQDKKKVEKPSATKPAKRAKVSKSTHA